MTHPVIIALVAINLKGPDVLGSRVLRIFVYDPALKSSDMK
jgi:hypothetical protein